ncbi:hypothetical protein [Providencia rettgeri]|uniref:hypothetical protein n=1 Tax=Providencia rettgeri TaxID=587 RepID=UPI0018C75318|nr:hypothetical protein [Providencia rettgeri]MBG5901137.1 hypothetical protein [Providencia rettgeri]
MKKQLGQRSKWLVTVFIAFWFNHGSQLNGETRFDFSGSHFFNISVTNVTYMPVTLETIVLQMEPAQD